MIKSTVTEKGQTTIPLPVRETEPQTSLDREVRSDGSVLIKSLPDVMELFGILGGNGKNGHNPPENNHLVREEPS